MNRSAASLLAAVAATLALAGCADSPTAVTAATGPVMGVDSLWSVDAQRPPCCTVDSAGVQVTILGGALTLRHAAHYTDTVITPAGPMSGACVHGVPSGSTIDQNWMVTLPDGSSYLLVPCDTGSYTLSLTRRLVSAGGATSTTEVQLSAGAFHASPDTVTLFDERLGRLATAIAGDTIGVTVGGHALRFAASTP